MSTVCDREVPWIGSLRVENRSDRSLRPRMTIQLGGDGRLIRDLLSRNAEDGWQPPALRSVGTVRPGAREAGSLFKGGGKRGQRRFARP